jgi:hypothetical protein
MAYGNNGTYIEDIYYIPAMLHRLRNVEFCTIEYLFIWERMRPSSKGRSLITAQDAPLAELQSVDTTQSQKYYMKKHRKQD